MLDLPSHLLLLTRKQDDFWSPSLSYLLSLFLLPSILPSFPAFLSCLIIRSKFYLYILQNSHSQRESRLAVSRKSACSLSHLPGSVLTARLGSVIVYETQSSGLNPLKCHNVLGPV